MDVPAGVTQEEGQTGFLPLPSAVLASFFLARRIQPFLSLVERVKSNFVYYGIIDRSPLVGHIFLFFSFSFFLRRKFQFLQAVSYG